MKNKGFTLTELAIVMVLVGLVLGGIIIGSSLITSARLQTVISDFEKYKDATNDFFTKYGYLPGDMPTASSHWNGAGVGDGDGLIEADNDNDADPMTGVNERVNYWAHLSASDFLAADINGGLGPITQYPNAYFTIGDANANASINYLRVMSSTATAVMTDADCLSIDSKLDDGVYNSGQIRGDHAYNPSSSTAKSILWFRLDN